MGSNSAFKWLNKHNPYLEFCGRLHTVGKDPLSIESEYSVLLGNCYLLNGNYLSTFRSTVVLSADSEYERRTIPETAVTGYNSLWVTFSMT